MRILCALLPLVVACSKAPPPPPVDLDTMLHGTRPAAPAPLIPSFVATAHDGTERMPEHLAGKPTVLWFFPAANTSGCTVEGCGYRDRYDAFTELGIRIVGVSFTDVDTNREWVDNQGFQYEIWHDDQRRLARYYGAIDTPDAKYPKRRTRILDASGALVLEYNDSIIVGAHPEEVLADVKLLFKTP